MTKIIIIAGSTRPGRFNMQPAQWFYSIAKDHPGIEVELVDLADINLPLLDEPVPASQNQYSKDHTKAWSKIVGSADGFVVVTPEYNHSMPAALKNAFDYLYTEWSFKPISFVSYGALAGGARAVEHLRGVAGQLNMFDIRDQILFPNYWEHLNEKGEYQFNERHAESAKAMIKTVAFWAEKMKEARKDIK
ncbi:MAG: hypothetical protein RL094_542 [Candidatus Parcubacteria bacterium]|jgi:NAD(P)H-dependent FMN reductase